MRNMSFAMTTEQVQDGTKTVTRRLGWLNTKPGDVIRPVRKCMGLKPGEKIESLRAPVRVVSVRREQLQHMMLGAYGDMECRREGFPHMTPYDFIKLFCKAHKGCTPETVVTRIEFEYTDGESNG